MLEQFKQYVLYQSPALMVYLGAGVLACMYYRRAPTACLLAAAGSVVLMSAGLASPLVNHYLTRRIFEMRGSTTDDIVQTMKLVGIGFGVCHAIGVGLLVAAIFTGRSQPAGSDDRFPI